MACPPSWKHRSELSNFTLQTTLITVWAQSQESRISKSLGDFLRLMLFLGRTSPLPDPSKSAAHQEGYRVRMRFIYARSALGRGSGGGLVLPQKSIGPRKRQAISYLRNFL